MDDTRGVLSYAEFEDCVRLIVSSAIEHMAAEDFPVGVHVLKGMLERLRTNRGRDSLRSLTPQPEADTEPQPIVEEPEPDTEQAPSPPQGGEVDPAAPRRARGMGVEVVANCCPDRDLDANPKLQL